MIATGLYPLIEGGLPPGRPWRGNDREGGV